MFRLNAADSFVLRDIKPNACRGASAMVWVDDVLDENTTTSDSEIALEAHLCCVKSRGPVHHSQNSNDLDGGAICKEALRWRMDIVVNVMQCEGLGGIFLISPQ